jgi:hypothetical protein
MSSKEIGNRVNPHKIHGSTALANTLVMIRWWLDRCEKGHIACVGNHFMRGKPFHAWDTTFANAPDRSGFRFRRRPHSLQRLRTPPQN